MTTKKRWYTRLFSRGKLLGALAASGVTVVLVTVAHVPLPLAEKIGTMVGTAVTQEADAIDAPVTPE